MLDCWVCCTPPRIHDVRLSPAQSTLSCFLVVFYHHAQSNYIYQNCTYMILRVMSSRGGAPEYSKYIDHSTRIRSRRKQWLTKPGSPNQTHECPFLRKRCIRQDFYQPFIYINAMHLCPLGPLFLPSLLLDFLLKLLTFS